MKNCFARIYRFFNQKPLYILAVIIFMQLLVIVCYNSKKNTLHFDEAVTLRISNESQLSDIFCYPKNKFITSQELKNSLKIEKNERFHYDFVYKNSKLDKGVPPLYYLLLHTAYSVYSFFSDDFSMQPGIVLNMVFFVLASIVLYFVSRFIFEPDLALLPNLLWGFSTGAISSVFFLRMYALVTVLYLLLLYIVFNIIRNKNASLKDYVFLGFTIYFGIMTHYHFVVWAFLVIAFYFIVMYRRSIAIIFKSCIAVLLAVVLSIASFPVTSNALNSGHRKWFGENFFNFGNFFKSLCSFFDFYARSFFGVNATIAAIIICVLIIALIVKKIFFSAGTSGWQSFNLKQNIMSKITDKQVFVFFTVLSFLFIIIIAYTSQHRTARYIWPVAPVGIIFSLFLIKFTIYRNFDSKAHIKRIMFILTAVLVVLGFAFVKKFSYIYANDKSFHKSLEYGRLNAVCVSNYSGYFSDIAYPLLNFKSAIFMNIDDKQRFDEILKNFQEEKEAVIILTKRFEKQYNEKVLQILEHSGWKAESLFKTDNSEAYIMRYRV